jgi:hypothetical protein
MHRQKHTEWWTTCFVEHFSNSTTAPWDLREEEKKKRMMELQQNPETKPLGRPSTGGCAFESC